MKNLKSLILFVTAGFSLSSLLSLRAADHIVNMYYYNPNPPGGFYYYSPTTITVPQGDTVTWVNSDIYPYGGHSATSGTVSGGVGSPNGIWDSGLVVNEGDTYTLSTASLSPGGYPYFCSVDTFYNMSGTIVVTAVVKPPPPVITSSKMLSGGPFTLTLSGTSGQTYTVEGSSNLLNWSPLFTNNAPGNTFSITDLTSTNVLQRFYRVR